MGKFPYSRTTWERLGKQFASRLHATNTCFSFSCRRRPQNGHECADDARSFLCIFLSQICQSKETVTQIKRFLTGDTVWSITCFYRSITFPPCTVFGKWTRKFLHSSCSRAIY